MKEWKQWIADHKEQDSDLNLDAERNRVPTVSESDTATTHIAMTSYSNQHNIPNLDIIREETSAETKTTESEGGAATQTVTTIDDANESE